MTAEPAPGGDVVLVWEFFGPRARGTAAHYREHLLQFLAREQVPAASVVVLDHGPFQSSARCTLPAAHAALVERALKPRRRE